MARPVGGGVIVGGLGGGAIGGALAGALAGAMDAQSSSDYQGPMLHIHADGLTLVQDRRIVVSSVPFQ